MAALVHAPNLAAGGSVLVVADVERVIALAPELCEATTRGGGRIEVRWWALRSPEHRLELALKTPANTNGQKSSHTHEMNNALELRISHEPKCIFQLLGVKGVAASRFCHCL